MAKNILIIYGHTDRESFAAAIADSYERGAREGGYDVERIDIGDLSFDPVLHKGYREIQKLEPDLITVQRKIKNAQHIVIVYPNWWGSMPAILKGMFDRMFLPGFAFRFSGRNHFAREKLLKKRSASVYITMNMHPFLARLVFGDTSNEMKRNILQFAGISPVNVRKIGPTERMAEEKRSRILNRVYQQGKNGS